MCPMIWAACSYGGGIPAGTPGDSVAHTLPVALAICHATISSVD